MKKLLIIEDAFDLREIYEAFLSEYQITFALEREEIEAVIETVDLVICDYSFNPNLSYEQVVELINGRKPVILCSGEPNKVETYGGVHKIDISKVLKNRIKSILSQNEVA